MQALRLKLSALTELLRDGEQGYKLLTEGLHSRELTLFCLEQSAVRAEYHRELARWLETLYGEVNTQQSWVGRAHHGWLALENMLNLSDRVLLGTAIHCEATLMASYEAMLEEQLFPELREILERQQKHLSMVTTHLEQLRNHTEDRLFDG